MNVRIFLSTLVLLFGLFACGSNNNNTEQSDEQARPQKEISQKPTKLSESDLPGTWVTPKGGSIAEFNEDGTFTMIRKNKKVVENVSYTINSEEGIIELETKKGKVNLSYRFEGNKLFLKAPKQKREIPYTKKNKAPNI